MSSYFAWLSPSRTQFSDENWGRTTVTSVAYNVVLQWKSKLLPYQHNLLLASLMRKPRLNDCQGQGAQCANQLHRVLQLCPQTERWAGGMPKVCRGSAVMMSGVYRRGFMCTPVCLSCSMVLASWKLKPLPLFLNPQDYADSHLKLLLLPFEGDPKKPPQNMPLLQTVLLGRP